MHPIRRFFFVAGLVAMPLAFSAGPAHAAETPARMNVLFIISDDLRNDLATYGHPLAQTPNLDRLAATGVRFDRAYCQYPLCNPSRSSMLTGRHPTHTNLYGNREYFMTNHPDWVSLPKYFKHQGYVTLRTGKIFHGGIDDTDAWTEGGQERRFGNQPPREEPWAPADQPITPEEEKERMERMLAADLRQAPHSDRGEPLQGPEEEEGDYRSTNRAIEFLRRYQDSAQPFFLAYGVSKPHSPLIAPQRFFDRYNINDIELPPDFAPRPTVPEGFPAGSIRMSTADLFIGRDASPEQAREMIRAYLACVSYVDWNVGRVLSELDTLGLADNTIVVFWGDHGYQLGEKGKWSKAGSLWEQGARVPFMIRDPRAAGNGTPSPRVVQSIDFYPTLADLCDLPIPDGLDGLSLAPLLQNPNAGWNHPAFTVWNERGRGISGVVVRTEQWRYAEFFGPGAGAMLIDPEKDPHELNNLVNDPRYAEAVERLSALIDDYAGGKTEPTPSRWPEYRPAVRPGAPGLELGP